MKYICKKLNFRKMKTIIPKVIYDNLLNFMSLLLYSEFKTKEGGYLVFQPLVIEIKENFNKKINDYFNYSIYYNYFDNVEIISLFKIIIPKKSIIKKHKHKFTNEIFISNKKIKIIVEKKEYYFSKKEPLIISKNKWHHTLPYNKDIIFFGIKYINLDDLKNKENKYYNSSKNYNYKDDKIFID
jgi:hypothetical protein